jgi:segregation and condensation protein B
MSHPKTGKKPPDKEPRREAEESIEAEPTLDEPPLAVRETATEEAGPAGEESARAARLKTPPVRNAAQAKAILECLLFVTVEPLNLKQIREVIQPMDAAKLRALVVELQNEYDSRGGGLQIVEVAGGYQMATRSLYADWMAPFRKRKRRAGLSVAMLETLAIIAYKQPIIRAEVDAIRGVDSSGTIHALQELELVEVVGQKQVPGRPFLYGTTKTFLKHFGLKSLSELPSIESLRERFELSQG